MSKRFASIALVVLFATATYAADREKARDPRQRPGVVKLIKKVVKSLADGLTVPKP